MRSRTANACATRASNSSIVQARPDEAEHAEIDERRRRGRRENSGLAAKKPKSKPGRLASESTPGQDACVSAQAKITQRHRRVDDREHEGRATSVV